MPISNLGGKAPKKRVLFVSESSFLNTGYGVYAGEILRRLHETGNYELAHHSAYIYDNDPRISQTPWRVIGNMPSAAGTSYNPNSLDAFGAFRFEQSCLDFAPDVVCSFSDVWFDRFIADSPYKPYYRWIHNAPVDSTPQNPAWLDTLMKADAVLTYSKWGEVVLREEGGGLINLVGQASPAADYEVFRPLDRIKVRKDWGFDESDIIIGTVHRNQPRKDMPGYFQAFRLFLDSCDESVSERALLYCHTNFPDSESWNIPALLLRNGLSNKVLFTYICRHCYYVFPSFWADAKQHCPACKEYTATMPNGEFGIDNRGKLAEIYSLCDLILGYASNEGFSMTLVEASACGVPTAHVDYSATQDFTENIWSIPIEVKHYFHHLHLLTDKAVGSETDLADILINMTNEYTLKLNRSDEYRERLANRTRQMYSYDKAAASWMSVIDSLPPAKPWNSPTAPFVPHSVAKQYPTQKALVDFLYTHVLGKPEEVGGLEALNMERNLQWGCKALQGHSGKSEVYSPSHAVAEIMEWRKSIDFAEQQRTQKFGLRP
jgi:glycosyltransferase involved in cell wall biosynthesis